MCLLLFTLKLSIKWISIFNLYMAAKLLYISCCLLEHCKIERCIVDFSITFSASLEIFQQKLPARPVAGVRPIFRVCCDTSRGSACCVLSIPVFAQGTPSRTRRQAITGIWLTIYISPDVD